MVLMSVNLGEDDLVVRLSIGIDDNIVAMIFTVKCTVITNLMNLLFFWSKQSFFFGIPRPSPLFDFLSLCNETWFSACWVSIS